MLSDKKGFSLIEITIVIAIIIVLTATLFPYISEQIIRARESNCVAAADSLFIASAAAAVDSVASTYDIEERKNDLSASRENNKSIAAKLKSNLVLAPDEYAKAWYLPDLSAVVCVDYYVFGIHYVNPPNFAVNDDEEAAAKGISNEAVSESTKGMPEGAVPITVFAYTE